MAKKQIVKNKLSEFAQQILNLDGQPFSLEGRDHLLPIYNHNKKKTIYMFSRQAEKSTSLAAKSVTRSCLFPYFKTLYVAPRENQVKTYSSQKLKTFVDMSYKVKKFFQNKACSTGVFYKSFSNNSDYTLRAAYLSPDATRGISSDSLYIDEFQDIIPDHLPVIESCLQHGKKWARFREYAGTPKSLQNHLEAEWRESKRFEWAIKCHGCNNYNILGVKNIGRLHMICSKCGKQIHAYDGQWVITNKDGKYPGFRICYLMVPWVNWNNPEDPSDPGVVQMYDSWPESKFLNETLAISCDSAENPLTEDNMKACCASYQMMLDPKEMKEKIPDIGYVNKNNLVAGIDWGTSEEKKSKTVLTIGFRGPSKKFYVLFMKKYNRAEYTVNEEIDDIIRILRWWGVNMVGSDWGFGYVQNAQLNLQLKGKIAIIYTSGSAARYINLNPQNQIFTISRTMTISRLILDIWQRNIVFFKWEDERNYNFGLKSFSDDFTNIAKEYSDSSRTTRYIHPVGIPDDSLFSVNYALCASHILAKDFSISGDNVESPGDYM